jgi:hypothetical protein
MGRLDALIEGLSASVISSYYGISSYVRLDGFLPIEYLPNLCLHLDSFRSNRPLQAEQRRVYKDAEIHDYDSQGVSLPRSPKETRAVLGRNILRRIRKKSWIHSSQAMTARTTFHCFLLFL